MARGARSRGGKVIDNVRWTLSSGSGTAVAAGSEAKNLRAALAVPETLMRIRGQVVFSLDGAQAPGRLVLAAWGVHVVQGGTGTTVLSAPTTDGNASWVAYGTAVLGYEEMVTDVIDVPGLSMFRFEVDSKAMRRLKSDDELQLVLENTTLDGGASINYGYALRQLWGS